MTITRERLLRWTFLLAFFAIPFGTKKFLFAFTTPFGNSYTAEYAAAFLFGTDLLLFAFFGAWVVLFPRIREYLPEIKAPLLWLGIFLLLAAGSIFAAPYAALGAYAWVRLFIAAAAGIAVWGTMRGGFATARDAAAALAASAVFESVVAILQFWKQGSIGLGLLGETVALGPQTPGVAAITVGGLSFLRAYGTLPHANILAGFLVVGLLCLAYWFFEGERRIVRFAALGGSVLVVAGLFLTFSRSGWITALCALIGVLTVAWMRGRNRRRVIELGFSLALTVGLLLSSLGFAVIPRATLRANEAPVRDRWVYDVMGTALIAAHPEGVGIGNELFYVYDRGLFHVYGLTARGQWQPIHNLYLLIASETGIAGLVAFLVAAWFALRRAVRDRTPENDTFVVIFLALLLFGLVDHFLWDLEAGRLMLWSVLGILLGLGTSPRRSMDRISPSEGGDAGSIPAEGTIWGNPKN